MPRRSSERERVRIVRREGSANLYLQWYDSARKHNRWRSTGTDDPAQAEIARARLVLELGGADVSQGRPIGSASRGVSIAAVLDDYLQRAVGRIASIEQARIAARHLTRILGDCGVADLAKPDPQQHYVDVRHAEGVKTATISRELSVLRAAIGAAADLHPEIARPRIYDLGQCEPRSRWLTQAEVQRLLKATRSHHVHLAIRLLLATAARPGAVLDLQWDQVDVAGGVIHLNPADRPQNAKHRPKVVMPPPLRAALEEAHAHARSPYVIEYHGRGMDSLRTAIGAAARRAGFPEGDVTPYVFRHTAATWLALDGVPLRDIAQLLGHQDTRMAERTYAHFHPDYQKRAGKSLARRMAKLDWTGPKPPKPKGSDKVSPQFRPSEGKQKTEGSAKSLTEMVGATGIEPVTPTMST